MKRIAVLVDWENFRKTLDRASRRFGISKEVFSYNDVDKLISLISKFVDEGEEIYRVFFYVSEPVKKARWKSDTFSIDQNQRYKRLYDVATTFLKTLRTKDLISIRRGKLEFRGYKANGKPLFTQKQVDMLIGIDIAHLSYLKLVDRVIVCSLDKDLVPALKLARINGLQVIIPAYMNLSQPSVELKEHADFVRPVDLRDLIMEFVPKANNT